MVLWKVDLCYPNDTDIPTYIVSPYDLKGHLECCLKYFGIKGLKYCYLFKNQAKRKAEILNHKIYKEILRVTKNDHK